MKTPELEYAGFWIRIWATIIDTILIAIITLPLLVSIYGWSYFSLEDTSLIAGPADFLISWVLPAIAIILFWIYKQATPGKIAVSCKILDAETGDPASAAQLIGRYLAYFVSMFPLGLGFIWVALDRKRQGWHDKLAGTVVVKELFPVPTPVEFKNKHQQ